MNFVPGLTIYQCFDAHNLFQLQSGIFLTNNQAIHILIITTYNYQFGITKLAVGCRGVHRGGEAPGHNVQVQQTSTSYY